MRLTIDQIPMIIIDSQHTRPIPPWPYVLSDEVELTYRLRSTRGGANARWWAGTHARHCLNDSHYQPVFRGVIRDFSWAPPSTRDNHYPLIEPPKTSEDRIYQGGTAVLNWTAKVVSPLPDEGRQLIASVIFGMINSGWEEQSQSQGHLTICIIPPLAEEDIPMSGSGNRWLYNHMIYPCRRYLWRVLDGVAHAIVQAGDDTWILSPDHPADPIHLQYRAWYWLSHPLPRIGGTD